MERHPDFETLLAFREHRLSGFVVGEVALHVGQCARCARLEESTARTLLEALATPEVKASRQRWLLAAAAAFAVLALATVAIFVRRDETRGAAAFRPPAGGLKPAAPQLKVVASLTDGANQIALLENGTVTGVNPRDAEDVRTVLSGRSIAIPTFIAAMPGPLRGDAPAANPLRVIEPFRSAVLNPRFTWTPVPGARSYRVAVFDADYDEVASSESITRTSWTPSKPLPSGVDLSWHVVAETNAGEISSSGSNRTEAVFRVLTPKEASEVQGLHPDSHLLRGLLYSRHGLLHDAEREYRALAKQNPDSPVARALVQSVSR
ncbi:MAG TPA: hypothetical protein VKB93_08230 [Thermoanaerobaculia bacterium]|nr:hypothetical protein [Thermoanaerobaculia bacterium]